MALPTVLLAFVGCAPNTTPDPRGGLARVHAAVAGSAVAPLPQEPSWTLELDQAYADLGNTVSSAGDVNADGYDDVIIGAPNYTNDQLNEGRAYLYLGSASGLSLTEDWSAESDQAFAEFGSTVAAAGDVNGDGYDDVLVGAPSYTNGQTDEGRAYLYLGGASGLSLTHAWVVESDQASSSFGSAVSPAGDINADGYDDVIVGAYNYSNGHSLEGRAYLYLGSASGLSLTAAWTAEANQASAYFGWSVASAGDVDADGYDDVLVGAFAYSNGESAEGRAYLYLGSASGLSSTADWTAEANQTSAYFGRSVSSAGDVNADGYHDVLVGASRYSNGQSFEGRAYLYLGSASGLSLTQAWTAEPDLVDISFGWSVASAGDVDANGYDDVMIGARYYTNGETEEGRAYLYLGSASGLSSAEAWSAESDNTYAYFGNSVASAGDVDADGYDDVIVGAPNYTDLEFGEGYAALYLGSCGEQTWYADIDGDTYGDPADTLVSCEIPDGFVLNGDDCDDDNDTVNPEAQEQCDAQAADEDCDGLSDDADPSVLGQMEWYADEDGDGFGAGLPTLACQPPAETVSSATDCDDTSSAFHPGAPEDCADPTDYNCDGVVSYEDNDGDNFAACEECDDTDPERNPGAAERCNDTDDDCDGAIDEDATDPLTFEADADGDGFTDRAAQLQACDPPEGYLAPSAQADCDDAEASVYPDAPEVPGDTVDQDCDGEDAEETEEGTDDGPGGAKDAGCGCAASPVSGTPVVWLFALVWGRKRSGGLMRAVALVMITALTGCSEYGLGGWFDGNKGDGFVEPHDGDGSEEGGGDGGDGPGDVFPGEDPPPDWGDWDDSCRGANWAPGGGPTVDSYVIDEPIAGLQVMLTVGDVDLIAREGPVEVELSGVTMNGAQGPRFDGDVLVLDYIATVGDLRVWAPPDLAVYDARMCVGDLSIDGLGTAGTETLAAEVRTGQITATNLRVGTVFTHNPTGDTELHHATAPSEVWSEGKTGFTSVQLPADRCDCTLDVRVGDTELRGITQDASAPLAVSAERDVGTVSVASSLP